MKSGRENKHHKISLICGIKKKHTNEFICRTETDPHTLKTKLWLPKEQMGVGIDWCCGVGIYTLWYEE